MPGNNLFDFGRGFVSGLGVKRAPSKYDYSKPRFGYVEGDGIAISSFWPNRFLPCRLLDKTTERGIVIPTGTLVSAKSFAAGNASTVGIGQMAEFGIDASGKMYIGRNYDGATPNQVDANSYFGYQEEQEAMMTISNGGVAVTDIYNSIDVLTGKTNVAGALIAAGDSSPQRTANKPTGIVIQDVWEDIRGRNLNYEQPTQQGVTIQRTCRIKIPYIVDAINSTATNMRPTVANTIPAASAGYAAVRDMYQFIVLPEAAASNPSVVDGMFVRPDILGKFSLWGYRWANQAGTVQTTLQAFDPLDAAYAACAGYEPAGGSAMLYQKVGRLQTIDRRFPKDMLEYVDTYPGSQTTGTDTAGLIQELFFFVDSIAKAGTLGSLSRQAIVNLVRNGYAGFAYIQLDV